MKDCDDRGLGNVRDQTQYEAERGNVRIEFLRDLQFMAATVEVIVADVSSGAVPEDTRDEQKSYPWMRDICNP